MTYDGAYYLVVFVFAVLGIWAVAHDFKKQIETGHKGHLRSTKNPVVTNLELFETFNPQKTEDESEEKE